jgi:vacuolar protein sorting-associated protein 13A/C
MSTLSSLSAVVSPPLGTVPAEKQISVSESSSFKNTGDETQASVDLRPELSSNRVVGHGPACNFDAVVQVNSIVLRLFDSDNSPMSAERGPGIARFVLSESSLRLKTLTDGSAEAQWVVRSFCMTNTRPGGSKFRDIIPAAEHGRNQFMLLYSSASQPSGSAMAVVTVDTPRIIFTLEPVFTLASFFTVPQTDIPQTDKGNTASHQPPGNRLELRLNLQDVLISVLESDADPATQAIQVSLNQIQVSRQVSLNIRQMGWPLFNAVFY